MIHAGTDLIRSSRDRNGRRPRGSVRRGISTLWLILTLPVLVILLALVVEIGNLWLARLELEAAMEAAALAAVKQWASNPSNTLSARLVGVEYAKTNAVRGQPVIIGTNAGSGPFGNNLCDSVPGPATLVFGALTEIEPEETFDARGTISPTCADANILFDATAITGDLGGMSTWGINFKNTAGPVDDNLRIVELIYDLRAGGDSDAVWVLNGANDKPVISTVGSGPSSRYQYGCLTPPAFSQAEVSGIDTTTLGARTVIAPGIFEWKNSQVAFRWNAATPGRLVIVFKSITGDSGFNVGDRFRFGAKTANLGTGGAATGDTVGQQRVKVTAAIASGTTLLFDATAFFGDTTYGNCGTGITTPLPEIDPALPANYPPASGATPQPYVLPIPAAPLTPLADGQSVATAGSTGTGGIPFAVRAQCFQNVPTVMQRLFGLPLGTFRVGAKATAIFDCGSGHPRLIHIEDFFCP